MQEAAQSSNLVGEARDTLRTQGPHLSLNPEDRRIVQTPTQRRERRMGVSPNDWTFYLKEITLSKKTVQTMLLN